MNDSSFRNLEVKKDIGGLMIPNLSCNLKLLKTQNRLFVAQFINNS